MARSVHLDGVQMRLYFFGFLGPLGLDSERFATPFLKCVSSNFSKKTNNPTHLRLRRLGKVFRTTEDQRQTWEESNARYADRAAWVRQMLAM